MQFNMLPFDNVQGEIKLRSYNKDPWGTENMAIVRSSWKLTAEAEAKLWDLQRRLSDIDHFKNEPETVLRFQVAPQGYEHAESGFRKMLEWRKENHVDTILQDYRPPQDLLDNAVCTMLAGADKDGDPIYVERGGAVDVGALLKVYGHKELVKCSIWVRELITRGAWLDEFEKQQGRRIKGVTVLYDLKGLSSKHMSPKVLSLFHDVMMIASDYYPAPIKRVIVIQAVPIFRYIWAAVKHIFRESIRRKIVFAGKDYVDAMDQYIDRKVLPACIAEGGCGPAAFGMPNIVGDDYPNPWWGKISSSKRMGGAKSLDSPYQNSANSSSTSLAESDDVSTSSSDGSSSQKSDVSITGSALGKGHWEEVFGGNGSRIITC